MITLMNLQKKENYEIFWKKNIFKKGHKSDYFEQINQVLIKLYQYSHKDTLKHTKLFKSGR